MSPVTGVDGPAVVVSDLEQSLAFYRGVLGLRVAEVKGAGEGWSDDEQARFDAYHRRCVGVPDASIRVALLEAPDGSHLELIEYRHPRLPSSTRSPARPGGVVIQLGVADSRAVVDRLRRAGAEVLGGPVPYVLDGVSSLTTYVSDPDGAMICLFEIEAGDGRPAP